MNNSDGNISRREVLMGSIAVGGLAALGAPGLTFAQEAVSGGSAGTSQFGELSDLLSGELITPANSAYDDARKVWNGMVDKRPAAIARCTGVAVQA